MPWKVFDEYYIRYDKWFERNKITFLNELRLIKLFNLPKPSIEIGVGTGVFSSELGIEYGLDPSFNMLKIAVVRGVESIAGIGENIPIRSETFNSAVVIVTICFLDDPNRVYNEIHRILRMGGKVLTCFIPSESRWGKYYKRIKDRNPFYQYANFYSIEEIKSVLKTTGFKISRIYGTLSYGPKDPPRVEEATENIENTSFVCVEAIKNSML